MAIHYEYDAHSMHINHLAEAPIVTKRYIVHSVHKYKNDM